MKNQKLYTSKLTQQLLLLILPLVLPLISGAQSITNLDTQLPNNAGPWMTWGGATADLTSRPGYLRITVQTQSFSGIEIPLGIALTNYPPPWHMEVAVERPTNINTAIGFISQDDGIQALWNNLTNPPESVFAGASWNATGLGAPPLPDFSGVPSSAMSGPRLIFYIGMGMPDEAGYSTMIWGVRTNENAPWSFAPPVNLGFDATQSPTFWGDWKLVLETRDPWFAQFGTNTFGPTAPFYVDINYINFYPDAAPPITNWDGNFSSGSSGPWQLFQSATGVLTNGYWQVTVPPETWGALMLPGGMSLSNYPPPWHMEVEVDNRPTNVNTAIGFISQYDGLQALFNSIPDIQYYNIQEATWNGSGLGVPARPDFGGSSAAMSGPTLIYYIGMKDDSNMVWGVRNSESAPWLFAPVVNMGFDMSASPTFWNDWKLMIEARTPWFSQFGSNETGPTNSTVLDFKYIHFFNGLAVPGVPSPPVSSLSTEFNGNSGAWGTFNGATADLTARPGFDRVTVQPGTFAGLGVAGGLVLSNSPPGASYPPPWQMQVAFERPTNVDTAIGLISQNSGMQALFYNLPDVNTNGFAYASWDPTGAGLPQIPGPDFSGIPASKMAGTRLNILLEMIDDTNMLWGVRTNENDTWAFAPVVTLPFSASGRGLFADMKLMIEDRQSFYDPFGATAPSNSVIVDFDYVRLISALGNITITPPPQGGGDVLTWPGPGTLQSATSVKGPWTDVPGGTNSPVTVTPTAPQTFYRVIQVVQ